MKIGLLLAILLVVLIGGASLVAQSFDLTVTVPAATRALITARVARLNAAVPAPSPLLTAQTLAQEVLAQCIAAVVVDEEQYLAGDIAARFKRATPTQRARAVAELPPD